MNSEPSSSSKVVMSAMRPTGKLHLGHYVSVLSNWVSLQNEYECYFHIADWHALTTQYDRTEEIRENCYQMLLDWLAAGLDPSKCTIYLQSAIPEIAELHLLLSMMVPVKWLETDPTLKDMVQNDEELHYGLLGYPVLQTCDILTVLGNFVPVGKDQLAHLEISRDIARRFNFVYKTNLFPEPKPLLTEFPLLVGLDGRKMSKSYNNTIMLCDSEEETLKKIKTAMTDPSRVRKEMAGDPDACTAVFPYYQVFGNPSQIEAANTECRSATRGCVACKMELGDIINQSLRPLRERRKELEADPGAVMAMLKAGNQKARETCANTMVKVREAIRLGV